MAAALSTGDGAKADDDAFQEWLSERAEVAIAQGDAESLALAVGLREHRCKGDITCFPTTEWTALDARAGQSRRPATLAFLANVATMRHEESLTRWQRVGQLDPDNAYPFLLQAGALWRAGEHSRALDILRKASTRDRYDDYFSASVAAIKVSVEGNPPPVEHLDRCTRELLPDRAGQVEIDNAVIFAIAADVGLPPSLGDFVKLCRQEGDAFDASRASSCAAAGRQMHAHATSLLSSSFGLALQRFSTRDEAEKERINAQQRSESERLYAQLWWTDVAEPEVRAQAASYWIRELSEHGELAAGEALVRQFGPVPETAEQTAARHGKYIEKARHCYLGDHES